MSDFIASMFGKKKQEPFLAVDIGSTAIKMVEFEPGAPARLKFAFSAPLPSGAVTNNLIAKPEVVANTLQTLCESNDVKAKKVVFCLPGPAVFTKKVSLSNQKIKAMLENIQFEAANYIPHKIEAVHLDYQILPGTAPDSSELLLVAVKNEVILSFVEAIEMAGLEPAIADVDYFALENAFELNYPELKDKTVALVDVGARFCGVNILQQGRSIFTGDVGVGGRTWTDALCESLNMQVKQAEDAKSGKVPENFDEALVAETIERTTEQISGELQRQLGFFWSAANTEQQLEAIFISGGGGLVSGLIEELKVKTGIPVERFQCFRAIDTSSGFDPEFLREVEPFMANAVGLALRRFGDKVNAEVA
jgi:type IV pilus assembly protein PilM